MSIAAVKPIVSVEPTLHIIPAITPAAVRIEGTISQLGRRGKNLFTFDGVNLRKVGRGEVASIVHAGMIYRGDLVAIAPTRAILHISTSRADHGVVKH